MKSVPRLACLVALPLALAACQGEKKAPSTGTAGGEILPGSVSDDMLPYDTVQSQPPLAPPPTATGKPGAKNRDGAGDSEAETDDGPGEAPTEASTPPAAAAPKTAE